MDHEALARELHDVAFAWNHTMPDWDSLRDEDRMWFTERARRMLTVEDEGAESDVEVLRRKVRSAFTPGMRFTPEQAAEAVHKAMSVLPTAEEASASIIDNYRRA